MGTHPIFESDFDCLTEKMRLAAWLRPRRTLQAIRLAPEQPDVTIYIGNEAGDLDSACCALALAYAMDQAEQNNVLHVPFLHYPKSHFNLKTEVAHALLTLDVEPDQMHYLHDEIDELKELHAAGRLRLVLADFTQNIVRIIDHHKQVEPVTVPTTCETRIELVGSCSSLVAAHCESMGVELIDDLKRLLATAILIDTANFAPNQLVDHIDRAQYARLTESLVTAWDHQRIYQDIIAARFAIDGLSIRELMLKDPKVLYVNKMVIFAATLHCALDDLLNQSADSWDQIREFVASEEAHKADLLLMMGTVASGENRGFGWYASSPQLENFNDKLVPFLESVELFKWSGFGRDLDSLIFFFFGNSLS